MNNLTFNNNSKEISTESKEEVELLKKTNFDLLYEK